MTVLEVALDFLEPHIQPVWLIPQYRNHALKERSDAYVEREGQQQVLRLTFPGIRDSVRELLGRKMDGLARKFHDTHDMKGKMRLNGWLRNARQVESAVGVCGKINKSARISSTCFSTNFADFSEAWDSTASDMLPAHPKSSA